MASMMLALVLYASLTGNTRRVAKAIADELSCPALDVRREAIPDLSSVGLLVVGDGVYFGRPSPAMRRVVGALPDLAGTKAAVFGTYGAKPSQLSKLASTLSAQGAKVIGEFSCPGRDWFVLGLLQRGRPSLDDLAAARAFARDLAEKAGYSRAESS